MKKITEITSDIATKHGLTKDQVDAFVAEMFSLLADGLQSADRQVKVKGLGTFKVTTVSARESVDVNTGERIVIEGREKVTYTPDATLRDRVNRPFAQFETVAVREGVSFEDIDNASPESIVIEEETSSTTIEPQPQATPEPTSEPIEPENNLPTTETENIETTQTELNMEDQPKEELQQTHEDPQPKTEETEEKPVNRLETMEIEKTIAEGYRSSSEPHDFSEDEFEDEPEPRNTLAIALGVILAVVLLAAGGSTYYLCHQLSLSNDSIAVLQTKLIDYEECTPSKPVAKEQPAPKPAEKPVAAAPKPSPASEKPKAKPAEEKPATNHEIDPHKYDSDARIRTGAYVITGVEKTVVAKEGQTLAEIARRYLGPGMECYVEAINGTKQCKAGDKVKIPSLRLKKAVRK